MRCPSCGLDVAEQSSGPCPRCGALFDPKETEATARLGSPTVETEPEEAGATVAETPRTPARSQDPFGPRRALYDFAYALRRALVAGGWFEAASAAAVGFLALLCVGVLFLVAARLQYPDLGAGTNPLSVFISIVVLTLAALRVPIHIGELTVTALPMGALLLSAAAVSWAVEPAIRRRGVTGLRARMAAGAKIAVPFALLCCGAALVFRFRGGATPTHAGALGALLLGAVWGTLFGALAGVRSQGSIRASVRGVVDRARARAGVLSRGLSVGALMITFSFLSAAAAGLVWVIAGLARGTPVANFGAGDAFAGFVYVVAFLPNILVAILAVSLGAPLDVGAQITIGGRQIGPLRTIALWDWGPRETPWLAFALLLVPVVALVGAGFVARRNRADARGGVRVVVVGAAVFAALTATLSWLGAARLGAGIVRSHGFAVIAADPLMVLVLGFAWGVVGGLAGWKLAERSQTSGARPTPAAQTEGEGA